LCKKRKIVWETKNVNILKINNCGFKFLHTWGNDKSDDYREENFTIDKIFTDENKDRINIELVLGMIDFKIGDKVLIPNWDVPEEMLKPRTIIGFRTFKTSEDNSTVEDGLDIITHEDISGDIVTVPYIRNFRLLIGSIRKFEYKLGGLEAGMKAIAKEKGISNFPKKDVHKIIGFLTDTGSRPLILFSNYCTQWFNPDFLADNFEFIDSSCIKYHKLNVTEPNIDKIKHQTGDHYLYYRRDRNSDSETTRIVRVENLQDNYPEYSCVDDYGYLYRSTKRTMLPRFGFITPRYTDNQMRRFGYYRIVENGLGGFLRIENEYASEWTFRRSENWEVY